MYRLAAFLFILGAAIGYIASSRPEVISVPGDEFAELSEANAALALGNADTGRHHSRFYFGARVYVAIHLMRTHGVSLPTAFYLAGKIKAADIDAGLLELDKAQPELIASMPKGGRLAAIFAWLAAHPEVWQLILALLLALA